jgi:hypothetical protein
MWVLHLGVGFAPQVTKSPKGYIKMNLNMGIASKKTQKKGKSITNW